MAEKINLFAKFGKKEHLELFKQGQLYCNPIQKYRDDNTDFRGDRNEGVLPLDPSKLTIKDSDGRDWFTDLEIPRPTTVMQSFQNDGNTFIFCSSWISIDIFVLNRENTNTFVLSDSFKNSIRRFGDYVLIFDMAEIHSRLNLLLKENKIPFGFVSREILYRDLNDYSETTDYNTAYNKSNSVYDRYFVKDSSYRNQSEWRILFDGNEKPLCANCGEGLLLEIGKLDYAYLFETPTFLNSFQVFCEKE